MGAEDTLITDTPHTAAEAMADAIIEVYGDTPQTQALIQDINEGDTQGALSQAQDLFGGDDNVARVNTLAQLIANGSEAFSSGVSAGARHESLESENRQAQATRAVADFLFNQSMSNFNKMMDESQARYRQKVEAMTRGLQIMQSESPLIYDEIDRMQAAGVATAAQAQTMRQQQAYIDAETQAISVALAEAYAARDAADAQARATIEALPPAARAEVTALIEQGQTMITAQYRLPGETDDPPRRHVIFKGENGPDGKPTYYIEDVPGQRVAIDPNTEMGQKAIEQINRQLDREGVPKEGERFGNDIPREEIDSYNAHTDYYLRLCEYYELPREDLIRAFNSLHRAEDKIEDCEVRYLRLLEARSELLEMMDDLDPAGQANREELLRENTRALAQIALELNRTNSRVTRGSHQLTSASETVRQIDEAKAYIEGNIERFATRHQQLATAYGPGGQYSVGEAWSNPLQTQVGGVARDVYRDNATGQLYWFDKDEGPEGTRHNITDIREQARLYREAYGDPPRMFKNETPSSEDPNNTFGMTFSAVLENSAIMAHMRSLSSQASTGATTSAPAQAPAAVSQSPELAAAARWEGGPRAAGSFNSSAAPISPDSLPNAPAPAAAPVS